MRKTIPLAAAALGAIAIAALPSQAAAVTLTESGDYYGSATVATVGLTPGAPAPDINIGGVGFTNGLGGMHFVSVTVNDDLSQPAYRLSFTDKAVAGTTLAQRVVCSGAGVSRVSIPAGTAAIFVSILDGARAAAPSPAGWGCPPRAATGTHGTVSIVLSAT